MLLGCASVAEAQTVLFDGANLTVNGVAVGQTTGSHARISLNAISNALHRDVDETERGWSIEFYFDRDSSIISQIWIETAD